MTTAATTELADCIATLKQAGENALTNPHVEDFLEIERYLGQLDSMVREQQQAMWSREAKETNRRLERQEPLTPQDHDVIRAFIVSDAEHYLDQENNFGDWLNEFRRLLEEMGKRANTADRESIGVLRGVLKDANRLVPESATTSRRSSASKDSTSRRATWTSKPASFSPECSRNN